MNAPTQLTVMDQATQKQKFNDKKRYWWALGPVLPVIGLAATAAYYASPKKLRAFTATGPALLHVIIPAIDKIIGNDENNPPDEAIKELENDPFYMRLVKCFIPAQYVATIFSCYVVSRKQTPIVDGLMLGISYGAINGIAINTAHELSHKSSKLEHYLSHLALVPTGYNHFRVEHPYGHHKRAATPEDPASSKMGETFWEFLPRTVIGSFKSAIEIETRRLERKGHPFWSIHNELLQGWAMTVAFHGAMVKIFGKKVIPFLVAQATYGIILFELINYIEHYGLQREYLGDGKYARTMPEHSWNNNNIVTNLFLYQLQRHSDHHAYPTRPFQALRHFKEAPELPSGYATMLLPALIPSMWFKLMDRRVYDHYKGDLNKANIFPKRRAQLMAKFAVEDQLKNHKNLGN